MVFPEVRSFLTCVTELTAKIHKLAGIKGKQGIFTACTHHKAANKNGFHHLTSNSPAVSNCFVQEMALVERLVGWRAMCGLRATRVPE